MFFDIVEIDLEYIFYQSNLINLGISMIMKNNAPIFLFLHYLKIHDLLGKEIHLGQHFCQIMVPLFPLDILSYVIKELGYYCLGFLY